MILWLLFFTFDEISFLKIFNMMKSPLTQLEQLVLTSKAKGFLREISKWTFFFSILGFINIALFVLGAIVIMLGLSPMLDLAGQQQGIPNLGLILGVFYLFTAILMIFPVVYLFKFSRKMKKALTTKSDAILADAFENLKSHFKFIGVLTIIVISLYVLVFIFSIFAGSLL